MSGFRCSICGTEISDVQYRFSVDRYGVAYCYAHMKSSNSERSVWKDTLRERPYKKRKPPKRSDR